MSSKRTLRPPAPRYAATFAALGEPTRLTLVQTLADGEPRSIAQLTRSTRLTRQAVTKHLHVLERARLVRSQPTGRETCFSLNPQPLHELRQYLDEVSHQWDQTLLRLKAHVED